MRPRQDFLMLQLSNSRSRFCERASDLAGIPVKEPQPTSKKLLAK